MKSGKSWICSLEPHLPAHVLKKCYVYYCFVTFCETSGSPRASQGIARHQRHLRGHPGRLEGFRCTQKPASWKFVRICRNLSTVCQICQHFVEFLFQSHLVIYREWLRNYLNLNPGWIVMHAWIRKFRIRLWCDHQDLRYYI